MVKYVSALFFFLFVFAEHEYLQKISDPDHTGLPYLPN